MKSRKKLHLDREHKKFLGVCAGIAEYLEVEPWSIRLVFLVSVFMGAWFLIPIYFVFYFCLDDKCGNLKEGVRQNSTIKHFKNVDYRKRLYRNTEEAKFLGVCAGLADYLEMDVTVVRLITFVMFFVAGPIPWMAYFAAWFVLDKKPARRDHYGVAADDMPAEEDVPQQPKEEFRSQRREFKRCTRRFSNLQRRLARIEAYVTSSQYKLHREFRDIS